MGAVTRGDSGDSDSTGGSIGGDCVWIGGVDGGDCANGALNGNGDGI